MRAWRIGAVLALAGLSALAGGCASAPATAPDAAALLARQELAHPFTLDEASIAYFSLRVPRGGDAPRRVQALVDALLGKPDGLGLTYRHDRTLTADEAFRLREGNCVSFVNLFVAASRALGLPAVFLEVEDYQAFRKEQGFVVNSTHVVAGSLQGPRVQTVDFLPGKSSGTARFHALSDVRAAALYHNNKAVELLLEGRLAEARALLERVLRLEPDYARAWNSLGVCLGRAGDAGGAVAAFERAVRAEPAFEPAHENLAAAYERAGEPARARAARETVHRLRSENPYYLTWEGDQALRDRRLPDAETLYRQALRREPRLADPHVGLARVALARGDRRVLEAELRKALALDPEHAEAVQLMSGGR